MSYIERVLQPNEVILARTRLHWFVYLPAILAILVAVAFLVVTANVPMDDQIFPLIGAGIFGVLGIIWLVRGWIRRATTELAVTDHRIIFKAGILSRHTIEMNRSKVESVDVEQSLWGRVFNYGTLIVRGTGGSLEPIRNIADPLAFRSYITAVETP